jgi:acyl transferase domain-containing protein
LLLPERRPAALCACCSETEHLGFFAALCKGSDGAVKVPFVRCELKEVFDANLDAPGKMYTCYGCFVTSADMFDNAFFGISSPEMLAMDPQQRALLEEAHDALVDAQMPQFAISVWSSCSSSIPRPSRWPSARGC